MANALNLNWTTVLGSDRDGTQTLINSNEVSMLLGKTQAIKIIAEVLT